MQTRTLQTFASLMLIFLLNIVGAVVAFAQCPTLANTANGANGATPLLLCNGEIVHLQTVANLPAGSAIDWYIGNTATYTPPAQGTLIGNTSAVIGANCPAVCPNLVAVFINACNGTGSEQDNEYIVFGSGSGFAVNDLQVDVPNNGTPANADININATPCGLQTPSAALIAALQAASGCTTIYAAAPGTTVPAGAAVVLFTSNTVTATYNFAGLCNQAVYVMQSNCHRTGGAFTNQQSCSGTAATRLKTTTISIAGCTTCSSHLTYSRCGLANTDGEFAVQVAGSDSATVNNGGIAVNGTNPCNGPNFATLPVPPDTLRLNFIATNLCNQTAYLRGVLTPTPAGCSATVLTQVFEIQVICPTPTISGTAVICSAATANPLTITGLSTLGAPWTYSWLSPSGNVSTSATINGNEVGNYVVTVTSANNCTGTASFAVANTGSNLSATITRTNAGCGLLNGSISVVPQGGTAPYTILPSVLTGLGAGAYLIRVTDAGGCLFSQTVILSNSSSLHATVTFTNPSNCQANGAFAVNASGGTPPYTFLPVASQTGLAGGVYAVTVTDAAGCSFIRTVTLTGTGPLITPVIVGQTSICNTTSPNILSLTGNYTNVVWTLPSGATVNTATVNANQVGVYKVVVTIAGGCKGSLLFNISLSNALTAILTGNATFCAGDNTVLTCSATTGTIASYLWDDNTTTPTNTIATAGSHCVTVTNSGGCTASTCMTITEQSLPVAIMAANPTICLGEHTALFATGGVSYLWYDGVTTGSVLQIEPINTTTYTVTATSASGACTASATIEVIVNPLPDIGFEPLPTCANGSVVLGVIANAGETIHWFSNETTNQITVTSAGLYSVTVTNAAGCTNAAEVELLSVNMGLTFQQTSITPQICNTLGSFVITPDSGTPPYTYSNSLGFPSNIATNLSAGIYTVTATDANNCVGETQVEILSQPAIITPNSTVTPPLCATLTGSIVVLPQGGTSPYTVLPTVLTGLSPNIYTVSVTDANGCTANETVEIIAPTPLSASLQPQNAHCGQGGSIVVLPQGGTAPYSFLPPVLTALPNGDYTVTITDSNGCSLTETATITTTPPITAMLLATPPTCYNEPSGSIEFINVQNAELPITVSVDNQAFMPTGAIGNLFAGLHTAALQDAAGCTWQDTITIPNAPIFTVDAGSDTTITLGDSLRITATVQGVPVAYNWHCANHVLSNSAAVSTVITPTQNTICRCSVLDAKGCVATDSILIRIKEFNDIYIPNAFTPNGDGNNDVFAIYAGITVKEIKLLRIFDRYGELVYEKLNFAPNTATWDGVWARYKNDYIPPPFGGDGGIEFVTDKSRAPSAVYAVYIEIELLNGQTKHLSSDLTVIR